MAYLPWQGRVVAGVMLGRGGRGFSPSEVALVESSLGELGVARAAYGLPWMPEPLPAAPATLLGRLGMGRRSRELEVASTRWGSVVVRDRAGYREMVARSGADELVWSRVAVEEPRRSGWPYVELLQLAPLLARGRHRALCVGCGGAVGVRQLASACPGIAIDLVETEPVVLELARRWFALDAIPNVTVHLDEGGAFIRRAAPRTWDVLVLDAYEASTSSCHLTSGEFLRAARRALAPGGALACNLIGTLDRDDLVSRFVAAGRALFDEVRVLPVVDPDEDFSREALRNVVVLLALRGKP